MVGEYHLDFDYTGYHGICEHCGNWPADPNTGLCTECDLILDSKHFADCYEEEDYENV